MLHADANDGSITRVDPCSDQLSQRSTKRTSQMGRESTSLDVNLHDINPRCQGEHIPRRESSRRKSQMGRESTSLDVNLHDVNPQTCMFCTQIQGWVVQWSIFWPTRVAPEQYHYRRAPRNSVSIVIHDCRPNSGKKQLPARNEANTPPQLQSDHSSGGSGAKTRTKKQWTLNCRFREEKKSTLPSIWLMDRVFTV